MVDLIEFLELEVIGDASTNTESLSHTKRIGSVGYGLNFIAWVSLPKSKFPDKVTKVKVGTKTLTVVAFTRRHGEWWPD